MFRKRVNTSLDNDQLDGLIRKLLDIGKQTNCYLIIRFQSLEERRWRYSNQEISSADSSSEIGVSIYIIKGQKLGFVVSNDLSLVADILQAEIDKLDSYPNSRLGSKLARLEQEPKDQKLAWDQGQLYTELEIDLVDSAEAERLLSSLAKQTEQLIDDNQEIQIHQSLGLTLEVETWRIVRSDGTDIGYQLGRARVVTQVTLTKAGEQLGGYLKHLANSYSALLDTLGQFLANIKVEIGLLIDQFGAEEISAGSYHLLIDSDLSGTLAHEAFGHASELDHVLQRSSILGDQSGHYKVGAEFASPYLNLVDYQSDQWHGFVPYSGFGNVRKKANLITSGKIEDGLGDQVSASKTKALRSTNAERSQDYQSVAVPRMSNTYIELDKSRVVKGDFASYQPRQIQEFLLDQGWFENYQEIVLILGCPGGQVETKEGSFMFGTSYVYLLNSEGYKAYKPVSFSGKVDSALKSVEYGFGKLETKSSSGYCGKAGQLVPVDAGSHQYLLLRKDSEVSLA
ncbi:TldD/PmbA family protein [Candidatus Saccharibacteria bacterium]|nr:TldD/PmbA family protein [Candidatus Saccharibacteria bacterium]MCB9834982.1 TldD/PmbA family protein [Candidatus Nomurabacteria bacterium]